MNRLVRAASVALLGGLLALGQAAPAAAIGAFGPVQELHRPCKPIDGLMEVEGDLAALSDGVIRGFVSFNGSADCEGSEIWYVERRNGRWSKQRSPYTGTVLAVAVDSTGTYLLHRLPPAGAVRITKRTAAGGFTGGRELSADTQDGEVAGDVIATGGTWWAVWSEPIAPFPEGTADLFQAKTIGTDVLTKRNLTNSPAVTDREPSIVLRPGPKASVAWTTSPAETGGSRIGVGTGDSAGRWNLRPFELAPSSTGVSHGQPDLAFAGTVTHLVWVRSRSGNLPEVVTANDRGGWRTVKVFNTRGGEPRVAMSAGKVFEAWQTTHAVPPTRVFAAERSTAVGSVWTGTTVSPSSSVDHRPLALSGFGGKATVLIWDGTRVYARTQS